MISDWLKLNQLDDEAVLWQQCALVATCDHVYMREDSWALIPSDDSADC